jgi:hypothetical protein
MNVLLIEDSNAFAIPIQQELAQCGHSCTWIVGAQRLENGRIVGIRANPSADPMGDDFDGDASRLIEIDPTQFDIALCDGELCKPVSQGSKFVQFLTAMHVPCIAITGGGTGNKLLKEAGAIDGLQKEFVVLALRSGTLNLQQCATCSVASSPTLKSYCDGLRQQYFDARKSGQKLVLGIPLLDGAA